MLLFLILVVAVVVVVLGDLVVNALSQQAMRQQVDALQSRALFFTAWTTWITRATTTVTTVAFTCHGI